MSPKIIWISIIVAILGIPVLFYGAMFVFVNVYPVAIDSEYLDSTKTKQLTSTWTMSVSSETLVDAKQVRITLSLYDEYGKPIRKAATQIDTFHVDATDSILSTSLDSIGDGTYVAAFPMTKSGMWVFEITAEHENKTRFQTIQKNITIPDDW